MTQQVIEQVENVCRAMAAMMNGRSAHTPASVWGLYEELREYHGTLKSLVGEHLADEIVVGTYNRLVRAA